MALNIDPSKFQRLTSQDIANSESMQVDWGSVASNLSKTLTDVRDDRERRKQEIQDRTDQAMQKLNEVPDLKNQTLLTAYYEGGDDAKNAMLTYHDQVKRGLAKTKDFKIFTGNVLTGFKGMSDSFKNFDGYYTDMMQKIKDGEVSDLTENAAESIESFASLKNKKIYTNPLTGQIQVVSMLPDKDGNFTVMPDPKKNPERFQNPMSVNSIMRFEEKRKVLLDEAKKLTDPLATVITASVNNGSVRTVEDFRQMDDIGGKTYNEWLSSQVDTLTANDSDIAQILSGQGYKFAGSAVEFKEKYPGLGLDKFIKTDYSSGSPVLNLTDGQKKRARGFAASAIESQLDSIVKKTQGFDEYRPSKIGREDKEKNIVGFLDEMNTVLSSKDRVQAKQILDRRIAAKNEEIIKGGDKQPLITDVDITDDEITIFYADGTQQNTQRNDVQNDSYAIFNFLSPDAGDDISTPVLDEYVQRYNLNFGTSNVLSREQIKQNYPTLLDEDKAELLKLDKNKNKSDAELLAIQQENLYQENTLSSKASQKPVEYIKGGNVLNESGEQVSADEFVDSELGATLQQGVDPPEQVQKEMVRLLGANGFLPVDANGNSIFKEGDISVTINDDKKGLTFKIGSTTFSIDDMYPMKTDAMITQLQDAIETEVEKINKNRTGTGGRYRRSRSKAPR